jgi:hypothetical protein
MTPVIPLMVGNAEFWGRAEDSSAVVAPLPIATFNTPTHDDWAEGGMQDEVALDVEEEEMRVETGAMTRVGSPGMEHRLAFGASSVSIMPESSNVFMEDSPETSPTKGVGAGLFRFAASMLPRRSGSGTKRSGEKGQGGLKSGLKSGIKSGMKSRVTITGGEGMEKGLEVARGMVRWKSALRDSKVGHVFKPRKERRIGEGRTVKTFSQNVAAIRAAVIVMFPPRRAKALSVLSEVLEERMYKRVTRLPPPLSSPIPIPTLLHSIDKAQAHSVSDTCNGKNTRARARTYIVHFAYASWLATIFLLLAIPYMATLFSNPRNPSFMITAEPTRADYLLQEGSLTRSSPWVI